MQNNKVIIFGTSQLASLAHFYLENDSEYSVAAFTVDRQYMKATIYEGLPVIAFDEIEKIYPPSEYRIFMPISFKKMNYFRKQKYEEAKNKGYKFVTYISSKATTWKGLEIGENCFIFEDNTIQPFAKIGNNCILWSGNHIGHHTVIKDHVFISSHVVISGGCTIEDNCFFGVNSTIRDETIIREATLVGMGAVITKDTEAFGIYIGPKSTTMAVKSTELDSLSHKSNG